MDETLVTTVEQPTGENVQEPAAPAETAAAEVQKEAEALPQETGGSDKAQSPEENAKFANIRRKAEEESDRKAQARVDKAYEEMFRGKVNPYTNRPITSEKDYKDYLSLHEKAQREEQLKNSGISQEIIQAIVNENPVVKQAKEVIERTQLEQGEKLLKEQVEEIAKLDPSIKNVRDIFSLEQYPQIDDLVKKGLDLVSAYKLANYDKLTGKAAENATNKAIQTVNANALASPGALGGGDNKPISYATMSDKDFEEYVKKAERGELMNV